MEIRFSPAPGPYERHLKRRLLNPLFPESVRNVTQLDIDEAQKQDEKNLVQFMQYFQSVVQQATQLDSSVESDVVLKIKEQLDECYATSCAMPGEHDNLRDAISKLIGAIMDAVRKGAADDPIALQKLDEEETARSMHNALHERKLIADLMLENSPILENELTATLLNEEAEDLAAALQLFTAEQLEYVVKDASELLKSVSEQGHEVPHAWERLQLIKDALQQARQEAQFHE